MPGGHLAILRSGFGATKESKVAAGDIVPVPGGSFEQTLASASPDVLREMVREFAQRMMDADVEVACNAGYGEVTADRVNSATTTAAGSGTPAWGPSSWPSRSCGTGRTSRRSRSTAAAPSRRWPRWWPRRPHPGNVSKGCLAGREDRLSHRITQESAECRRRRAACRDCDQGNRASAKTSR
jgi:hypothetical protein